MNKIEIRGVIVSADWDDGWMEDWISKGVMTPESRVRTQLAEANPDEPLTVYVNSVGGSVMAGNEIINSLNAWAAQTGQPINIVVGSLAASMAANLLVAVPATVSAHSNAKIMFHGPSGCMCGGAGAMSDTAELLELMGADMKAKLLAQTTLAPERVEEGFAEGRELWISAEEAKEIGLIAEIVEDVADAVEFPKAAADALTERGMKIAAVMDQFVDDAGDDDGDAGDADRDDSSDAGDDSGSDTGDASGDGDGTGDDAGDAGSDDSDSGDGDDAGDASSALVLDEAKVQEMIATNIQLSVDLEVANATIAESREFQAKHDRIQTELIEVKAKAASDAEAVKVEHDKIVADLTAEHASILTDRDSKIDGLESKLGKLTLNALAFSPDSITSWPEAMKSCDGDYAAARKKYPSIHAQFMKENRNKGR